MKFLNKNSMVFLFTLLGSSALFAQIEYQPNSEEYKKVMAGLPLPDSGVTIISGISKNIPEKLQEEEVERRKQQKSQGFSFANTTHPQDLIFLSKGIGINKEIFSKNTNPENTEIKERLDQLFLGFPFLGINNSEATPIGFAVMGAWTTKGWTGVVEYFNYPQVGVCQLSLNNIKLSHAAIMLDKDIVSYDINNKITTKFVKGNQKSGFIYSVNWYDNTFFYELECAKKLFDKENISKMIELAINIDIGLSALPAVNVVQK